MISVELFPVTPKARNPVLRLRTGRQHHLTTSWNNRNIKFSYATDYFTISHHPDGFIEFTGQGLNSVYPGQVNRKFNESAERGNELGEQVMIHHLHLC